MKNDPRRFHFQLSTTFRQGVNRVKTEKMSTYWPKLTFTTSRKKTMLALGIEQIDSQKRQKELVESTVLPKKRQDF